MARKIYDIKPPKLAKQVEEGIKDFLNDTKKNVSKKRRTRQKAQSRSFLRPVLVGAGLALVLLSVYLFFKLPKAEIQIWPKVDILSYDKALSADKSVLSVDVAKTIVPAQYFEASKSGSQQFPATGNASNEGKATGIITIYNKSDPPSAVTLKAGTHFLSNSGKYFVTLEKVIIPAGKKSGGKVSPGSIQVKVEAAEGGEAYNIAPANFSVPKLSGTAYFTTIYAESTSAMTGGYAGKIKKITDDDIQSAKDALIKKLYDDALVDLKAQLSQDYILLDNAISYEVISFSSSAKSGATSDSFTEQAEVKTGCLVFKKSDLEKFAKDYISSQIPEGRSALDSSFKIDYSVSKIDIGAGKAEIKLVFSSGIYKTIDKNSLSLLLAGKNPQQIKDAVASAFGDQISKVQVGLWPFWVKKAPDNQRSVKVDLKFE